MESPAFRLDIVNGQTGAIISRQLLHVELADEPMFSADSWPIDAETRCTQATPRGYPLEFRVRRII